MDTPTDQSTLVDHPAPAHPSVGPTTGRRATGGRSVVAQPAPSATTVVVRAAVLPVGEAAERLGITPARVRALVARGLLTDAGHGTVSVRQVDDLADRDVVRSLDAAAVEGVLDKALRRRLPAVVATGLAAALDEAFQRALGPVLTEGLAAGLVPVAREMATALADIELSTEQRVTAALRAQAAEQRADAVQQEADTVAAELGEAQEHIAWLEQELAVLRQQNTALRTRRTGLLRRRQVEISPA